MKLAEALVHRSDCQRKIAQLKQRLERVVKVQEGEEPGEQPAPLFEELRGAMDELKQWVKKINKTNSYTAFDATMSLADALAERDHHMQQRKLWSDLLEMAAIKQERYSRQEVKFHRTVNVAELQKEIDDISKRYRELDFKIQEKNWSTELLEN
ncbi:DIP1984 family protein [Paenibacillus aurantiacus]|uniref:DIP1984 family protein n=1 Tax=Paenibacillus aurantiacus TaxID=1936118 RepID=A0ABV5KSC1_9BACL